MNTLFWAQMFVLILQAVVSVVLILLNSYLKKKGENQATKEDIESITKEIERVKADYKQRHELSRVEREFYYAMTEYLEEFLAVIKRTELEQGTGENSLTAKMIMEDKNW